MFGCDNHRLDCTNVSHSVRQSCEAVHNVCFIQIIFYIGLQERDIMLVIVWNDFSMKKSKKDNIF